MPEPMLHKLSGLTNFGMAGASLGVCSPPVLEERGVPSGLLTESLA